MGRSSADAKTLVIFDSSVFAPMMGFLVVALCVSHLCRSEEAGVAAAPQTQAAAPQDQAAAPQTPAHKPAASQATPQEQVSDVVDATPQNRASDHCPIAEESLRYLNAHWHYGGWVYGRVGPFPYDTISECKLQCDLNDQCHRWVFSCLSSTCIFHGYGGFAQDAADTYYGEADDIKEKTQAALALMAQRKKRELDAQNATKQREAEAAAQLKKDAPSVAKQQVEAAKAKAATAKIIMQAAAKAKVEAEQAAAAGAPASPAKSSEPGSKSDL